MISYRQNYTALHYVPPITTPKRKPRFRPHEREVRPQVVASKVDQRLIDQMRSVSVLTGITTSRIGRDAVNDPRMFGDLLRGRMPGDRTREKLLGYLRDLARQHREARHG